MPLCDGHSKVTPNCLGRVNNTCVMKQPLFSVVPLSKSHVREGFCCGSEALDHYFSAQVGQDIKRNITKCFVAIDNADQKIAGYYTLSAAQIPLPELPEKITRKMTRYGAVPDTTSTVVLDQMPAFNQVPEVHLQGVAAGASQLCSSTNRDAPMFTGKLDDLQ